MHRKHTELPRRRGASSGMARSGDEHMRSTRFYQFRCLCSNFFNGFLNTTQITIATDFQPQTQSEHILKFTYVKRGLCALFKAGTVPNSSNRCPQIRFH